MTSKAKMTAELNGIIAAGLDILDWAKVTRDDIKKGLEVSSLIGMRIKNENRPINCEYPPLHDRRKIKAPEANRA